MGSIILDISMYQFAVFCHERPVWLSIHTSWYENWGKVHISWEGHEILQNLHQLFFLCNASQIIGGYFAKFCGLLRIYEL